MNQLGPLSACPEGQYTDAESGLIYMRARYYDPGTANFISRDPLESLTGAPYSYVANNPLNDTDPLGLMCFSPTCLVNDAKHVAGAVQTVADVTAAVAAPIPVVGEVVAGGALAVSEGAGFVGSAASCAQWIMGDSSAKECITDVAINVGTAGVGRLVAPGSVVKGKEVLSAADKGIRAGVNLFGDLLGWSLGYPSSRNAGYLGGQGRCDPGPRFEPARR